MGEIDTVRGWMGRCGSGAFGWCGVGGWCGDGCGCGWLPACSRLLSLELLELQKLILRILQHPCFMFEQLSGPQNVVLNFARSLRRLGTCCGLSGLLCLRLCIRARVGRWLCTTVGLRVLDPVLRSLGIGLLVLLVHPIQEVLHHARTPDTDVETERTNAELRLETSVGRGRSGRVGRICVSISVHVSVRVRDGGRRFIKNRSSACRASLLTFKPASQTSEMEDMAARKLLCSRSLILGTRCPIAGTILRPRSHSFTADNAVDSMCDFLRRGIRISRVHVSGRSSVANKVADSSDERAEGDVDIADDVERETVPREDNREEG